MTVLEWFFAHFFARFSDIPDVQGLFGEKIYTSQMKGWGAPIWDAVELRMALARWNALVRNITTPELLSGCLNVNLCVEAKEAGTLMVPASYYVPGWRWRSLRLETPRSVEMRKGIGNL